VYNSIDNFKWTGLEELCEQSVYENEIGSVFLVFTRRKERSSEMGVRTVRFRSFRLPKPGRNRWETSQEDRHRESARWTIRSRLRFDINSFCGLVGMHRRATRILPWMDVFPVFLCHDTFLLCSLANVRFWNVAFRKDRRHRSAIHHHGNPALIDDLRAQHMVDKGETRHPVHVPTF
jgi:hypothetical protein